jgi:hypothetical protein
MLILVVVAMLVMGVLSISFALLADMEVRIGVSYKQQAQAEALGEAALELGRDAVRTAPTVAGGFTTWFQAPTSHNLFTNNPLNGGTYSARIDNDCAVANTVPTPVGGTPGIEEPPHGGIPCNNTEDYNETAVITAWAESANGRSRVRAMVAVDNPWKHVCSNAKPDNNGYCNEALNRNGNPTITPSDPNDPNGPAAYNTLPYPVLGCSRIAPALHKNNADTVLFQNAVCGPGGAHNNMKTYPYPTGAGVPRFVLMGEVPGPVGGTPRSCNDEPNAPGPGAGNRYFGYFDCALSTYCDPAEAGTVCGQVAVRKGCLHPTDTRVVALNANQLFHNPGFNHYVAYNPALGQCGGGTANEHGMVYKGENNIPNGGGGGTVNFISNIGSQTKQFTVYVLNGNADFGNNQQFYGTFVVESNENVNPAENDFAIGNGASPQLWAGPAASPTPVGWTFTNQYGFPLAALIYNPDLPPPTVTPTYAPQGTYADMGSSNTEIHGMVYSGGHVEFNPLSFDGTVVAFEIQTQGSASYVYNPWYGNNTPPPGFPIGGSGQVVIIRKSFVVCVNYNNDSGAATGCN